MTIDWKSEDKMMFLHSVVAHYTSDTAIFARRKHSTHTDAKNVHSHSQEGNRLIRTGVHYADQQTEPLARSKHNKPFFTECKATSEGESTGPLEVEATDLPLRTRTFLSHTETRPDPRLEPCERKPWNPQL